MSTLLSIFVSVNYKNILLKIEMFLYYCVKIVHFTPAKAIVFQGGHILPTIYIVFFGHSWYINIETYVY
jgi:hypothetical protein